MDALAVIRLVNGRRDFGIDAVDIASLLAGRPRLVAQAFCDAFAEALARGGLSRPGAGASSRRHPALPPAGRVSSSRWAEPKRRRGGPRSMSSAASSASIGRASLARRTVRAAPAKLPRMSMLSPEEEEEGVLIERSQAGDRLAFEELVRRHADRLYAVVLRFLGSDREAEDVTQETFLRAWRGIGGFKGSSRFYTWLYRIGLNEAKRRASRRPPPGRLTSLDDDPRAEVPDYSSAPQTRAAEAELRAVLEGAVGALDPDYREPLILRDVEGLSTAEAAEVMGLREAAFKSRLHRARLVVREAIDEYLGEER